MEAKDPCLRYLPVQSADEALGYLRRAQADPQAIQAILPQMVHVNLLLEGIDGRTADLVRQEMRYVGADALVTRRTASDRAPDGADVILTGTLRKLRSFAERIAAEPFGMERLAERIGEIIAHVTCGSHCLKTSRREIRLGERTLIMGILNVTPDSFSDGGKYADPDRAFARALELEEQGADVIDIGAESTRPGSARIGAAEELRRLIPVLKRLRGRLGVPISVDTYKAEVAERALEHGAEIINDPTGLTFEPQLARVVSNHDAGLILNHMRGRPETWAKLPPVPDVMGAIVRDLEATVSRARRTGIDRAKIVVDPGIGFGKRKEQNAEILARLPELARLELPLMVGPSRKSFLAHPTETETAFATAAAVAAAVLAGAHIVRVHDVREMRAAADVADEILRSYPE